jgi:transcriptional regulator with XRE-family HTH domain
MLNLKIGEKIKEKRRDRDLTQEELATMLGVTKAAVSKWENAESFPDITMLPQIAQLFHITMDELFDYTLEYKPAKIVNQYRFGLCLNDIEDISILDYGTIKECSVVKNSGLVGDETVERWEVRVQFVSTEEGFPYLIQKCLKPNTLVDGVSVRLADGKIFDDDKPNKHYVCKEKVWEYRNTNLKYIREMIKEQIEMGLISEEDAW